MNFLSRRMSVQALATYKRWLAPLLALLIIGLTIVACQDELVSDGGIEIRNARAQFTTTDVGVVYFDIHNMGEAEVLVDAFAELADDTQIHEVITDGASTIMRPVESGISIAANGRVRLAAGGYHLMLLGVEKIPEVGSTFQIVLEFENSSSVSVTVQVQDFGEDTAEMHHSTSSNGEGVDHSHMDNDEMDGKHEKEHD
ncbi:MAG: hypothetical protein CL897_02675 [Dehalococcoidia bacterium]|nr:hypothetical protein [Dehalococcoidia bacterium]HCU99724.1 hypothetical protein [Dehalococcoidia bacterium]|tara:strand:- start:7097 stop:7693 length:597 start_codon:yes stop_codon:yes gene_type:complete